MNNKKNICIGYLTNNLEKNKRLYSFKPFIDFLNKCKYVNNFYLLLLINPTENNHEDLFINILKKYGKKIKYSISKFDNNNNYIKKIRHLIHHSLKNKFDFCLKLDNDIIINNYILDFMYENINLLENKKNLFMTPILSSGIPTCDTFIDNFFDISEKKNIHNIFKNTKIPKNLWGFNYNFLNKYTIHSENWEYKNYSNALKNINYHYKGIHPIRINDKAAEYLKKIILKNKNKVFEKQNYRINITNDFVYFCNSIFLIKPSIYNEIINDNSLYVDIFDEVPVNKFSKKNNLNGIFIENSFSIHPYYNSISNHLKKEEDLFKKIFNY